MYHTYPPYILVSFSSFISYIYNGLLSDAFRRVSLTKMALNLLGGKRMGTAQWERNIQGPSNSTVLTKLVPYYFISCSRSITPNKSFTLFSASFFYWANCLQTWSNPNLFFGYGCRFLLDPLCTGSTGNFQ